MFGYYAYTYIPGERERERKIKCSVPAVIYMSDHGSEGGGIGAQHLKGGIGAQHPNLYFETNK